MRVWQALAIGGALSGCGIAPGADETNRHEAPVLNGDNRNPAATKDVRIQVSHPRETGTGQPATDVGSGILLDNSRVLTAAHIFNSPFGPPRFAAVDVEVTLFDPNGTQTRHAVSLPKRHPTWPINLRSGIAQTNTYPWQTDVALIELDSPFTLDGSTGNFQHPLSGVLTDILTIFGDPVRCRGYGVHDTSLIRDNQLRGALLSTEGFDISLAFSSALFRVIKNDSEQILHVGDSGGGCFLDSGAEGADPIVGVTVRTEDPREECTTNDDCGTGVTCLAAGVCNTPFIPNFSVVQAAQSFVPWVASELRDATPPIISQLDFDDLDDEIRIAVDIFNNYAIDIQFGNGLPLTIPTLISTSLPAPSLGIGDYDGDDTLDLVVLAGGEFAFFGSNGAFALPNFLGSVPSLPLIQLGILSPNAAFVNTVLVSDDNLDDIEIVDTDGKSRLYVATGTGFQPVVLPPRGFDFDGDFIDDVAAVSLLGVNFVLGTGSLITLTQQELTGNNDFEAFARDLAWGDFDGSCRAGSSSICDYELVIAAPFKTVDGVQAAGGFYYVRYDFASRMISRFSFSGLPETFGFGSSFAAGDFNGDGYDDLAVTSFTFEDAPGSLQVIYGKEGGLDGDSPVEAWVQEDFGLSGDQVDVLFAMEVGAGDFNCDGLEDLVVSAPSVTVDGVAHAGSVFVLNGSSGSLHDSTPLRIDSGVVGDPQPSFRIGGFGSKVAAGNFNGDDQDGNPCIDLAIAAFSERRSPDELGEGAVYVVPGGPGGLDTSNAQRLIEGEAGLDGTPVPGDDFGYDLAIVRANGDEFDDLVIGVPGDQGDTGSARVALGSADGIASSGHATFRQGEGAIGAGLLPDPEDDNQTDMFGWSVGGTSKGVIGIGSQLESLLPLTSDDDTVRVEGAGLLTLVQLEATPDPEVVVDGVEQDGELFFAVEDLSDEFFTTKDEVQSWSGYLAEDYFTDPYNELLESSAMGDSTTGARPGHVNGRRNVGPSELAALLFTSFGASPDDTSRVARRPSQATAGFAGFDNPVRPWTSPDSTLTLRPDEKTEGTASLEVRWGLRARAAHLLSPDFRTTEWLYVGDKLAVDVLIPEDPGPHRRHAHGGTLGLTFSVPVETGHHGPRHGRHGRTRTLTIDLGNESLARLSRGAWHTLEFQVPRRLRNILLGDSEGAKLAFTMRSQRTTSLLFDNLRFSGTLERRTVFPPPTRP